VVDLVKCQACHRSLVLHGNNRNDNINGCVTCHNPRNTDREVRAVALIPPTDGKGEESLDFKTMIHGIHAAEKRENPLQIVGFGGFSTHVYDEEEVHYPGRIDNCLGCHADDTYTLPLAATVLGTTVATGADRADPADDIVVSPMAAVCASCHDAAPATAHMQANGAAFATTQAALDSGAVVEQCAVCHGADSVADVVEVHRVRRIE
jgi:OmcA/MtrC family decaheme c-type cytochrome